MPDAHNILIEAGRGALAFFKMEKSMKGAAGLKRHHRETWLVACSGKRAYESGAAAHAARGRHKGARRPLSAYRCRSCKLYHLGG